MRGVVWWESLLIEDITHPFRLFEHVRASWVVLQPLQSKVGRETLARVHTGRQDWERIRSDEAWAMYRGRRASSKAVRAARQLRNP